ncbi:hypothetical protein AB0469_31715 [Streptomyces sp. NPDC093801]|uniref:hypothetical protein n=1 Tax=Streptomyces sp. NPDC093801 TaxID=3155203 RepID=UPI00344F0C21
MSRFEYTDPDGDRLAIEPALLADSTPAVALIAMQDSTTDAATIDVPLDRVEEVVAGIRDMARQAAYTAAYHRPCRFPGDSPAMRAAALSGVRPDRRRTLTELEHDRAWHAIEGAAEDGADPGTVLAAVLHALGIDPPGSEPAGAPITDETEPYQEAARRAHRRLAAVERLASGRPGYHQITVKALLNAMSDADEEAGA